MLLVDKVANRVARQNAADALHSLFLHLSVLERDPTELRLQVGTSCLLVSVSQTHLIADSTRCPTRSSSSCQGGYSRRARVVFTSGIGVQVRSITPSLLIALLYLRGPVVVPSSWSCPCKTRPRPQDMRQTVLLLSSVDGRTPSFLPSSRRYIQ